MTAQKPTDVFPSPTDIDGINGQPLTPETLGEDRQIQSPDNHRHDHAISSIDVGAPTAIGDASINEIFEELMQEHPGLAAPDQSDDIYMETEESQF